MISVKITWTAMKEKSVLKYVSANGNYYIYSSDSNTEWSCVINGDNATDFENTLKASATNIG